MNQLLDECSRFRDEMGEVSDYITLGTALETIWSGIAGQRMATACLMQKQRSWCLTCPPHSSQVASVLRCRQQLFLRSSTRRQSPAAGSVLNLAASQGCCRLYNTVELRRAAVCAAALQTFDGHLQCGEGWPGDQQAEPRVRCRPCQLPSSALRLPCRLCGRQAGAQKTQAPPAAQTQSSRLRWSWRLSSQHQQMAADAYHISILLSRSAHYGEAHCSWSHATLA